MKKIYILFALILGVCLVSCGSAPVEEKSKPEAPVEKETKTTVDEVEDVEDEVELINEEVKAEEIIAQKILQNGQLIIERSGVQYTIQGQVIQ